MRVRVCVCERVCEGADAEGPATPLLPPPPPAAAALVHARAHRALGPGFRARSPGLDGSFHFRRRQNPWSVLKGWSPKFLLASAGCRLSPLRAGRGKGPAHRLCCGNPGYLVSGCHRNFARRLETGRNRPFESVGELTLRDSNSGLEIVFHAEPVLFSRVKDTRTPPPDGLKDLFTEIDRDPQ